MNPKRLFLSVPIIVVMAALAIPVTALTRANSRDSEDEHDQSGKLLGTWDVILTSGDFQEKERYTFIAGRSHHEGSLVFSNEIDAVPPCSTDHGVWTRTGRREFTTTHGAFCIDLATVSPAFTIKWREVITLNRSGNRFTGRGLFEVFAPDGEFQFSATYTLEGTRMKVEPPPDENTVSSTQVSDGLSKWRDYLKKRSGVPR